MPLTVVNAHIYEERSHAQSVLFLFARVNVSLVSGHRYTQKCPLAKREYRNTYFKEIFTLDLPSHSVD